MSREYLAGNYRFKVNNKNTRTKCEICSKLTIKTSERFHRRSSVFNVNYKQVNAGWVLGKKNNMNCFQILDALRFIGLTSKIYEILCLMLQFFKLN